MVMTICPKQSGLKGYTVFSRCKAGLHFCLWTRQNQVEIERRGLWLSMVKSATAIREAAGEGVPTPEEIRQQFGNILASPPFHGSKRCHQFLEYVCEQAPAGETGALKERAIAIAVFGRQPHSDLGEDTIVRVGAREVRKRLAQYYVTPEGASAKVRIDLPSGGYTPEFSYIPMPHEEEAVEARFRRRPRCPSPHHGDGGNGR
jgi:hypothetical protein